MTATTIGLVEVSTGGFDFETRADVLELWNRANSRVSVQRFGITPSGVADVPESYIDALEAYMAEISGTAFAASSPPDGAKLLYWNGGKFSAATFTPISLWGTGATVLGDGMATQLDGFGFVVNHNRAEIHRLNFVNTAELPDATALSMEGDGRRFSNISNIWINGYETGIAIRDVGGFDQFSNIFLVECGTGLAINRTLGTEVSNLYIIQSTSYGVDISSDGELKISNAIIRGSDITNMYIHGSALRNDTGGPVVEHYFNQVTLTGATTRSVPIVSVSDDGGLVRLTTSAQISATITDGGSILYRGTATEPARGLIQLSGSAGSVTDITANGVSLMSAPVAFTTSLNNTATLVAANINAGTGTHGFTATASSQFLYIFSPLPGSSRNGQAVTTAVSGGMTAAARPFIAVTCASPHGFITTSVLDLAEFDTAPYAGVMPVRHIASTTVFYTDCTFAGGASGLVCKPHFFVPTLSQVRIANSGAGVDALVDIVTAAPGAITINTSFSGFPALSPSATLTVPGWDLIIDAEDGNNARTTDQFFNGGNINYILILSGLNLVFKGVRIKCQIHVVTRANDNFQAAGVVVEPPARGRQDDATSVVPVTGANKGWILSGADLGGASDADDNYYAIIAPNKNVALSSYVSSNNELRVYQNKIEHIIAGEVVLELDGQYANFLGGSFRRPTGDLAINHIEIQSGISGARTFIRQRGEDNTGIAFDIEPGGAYDFQIDGARQFRILDVAAAVNYYQATGSTGTSAPRFLALGTATNLDVRLTPKGDGTVFTDTTFRADGRNIGNLPVSPVNGTFAYVIDSNSVTPGVTYTGGGSDDALIMRLSGVWVIVIGKA